MNLHKLKAIVDFVRRQGRLPTDRWNTVLNPEDLVVWFGLDDVLTPHEQEVVKAEFRAMAEAESTLDQLRGRAS